MDESIDWIINQGADWTYLISVQNDPVDPGKPLSKPVNLRGCSAVLTAAGTLGASKKLFVLSTADGSLVITPDTGMIRGRVFAATTALFTASSLLPIPAVSGSPVYPFGFYTTMVTNATGSVVRESGGRLYLRPSA